MGDWVFEHSVLARVSPGRAWTFWTNIDNWSLDAAVEWVRLDRPFAAGAKGITKSRGAEPVEWTVKQASPPTSAVIEMAFPGAVVAFEWTFEEEPGAAGTRLRQRVRISGPQAAAFVAMAEAQLVPNLPEGMLKLAEAMARAEPR